MSNSGQNNFKGLDFQTQMALIEFLEHVLHRPDFLYVHLEDLDWKDFTLYFQNGDKIICEVKYRSQPITLDLVLAELKKMNANNVREKDKIRIITTEASQSLLEFIKQIQNPLALQFSEDLKKKIKEKGISDSLLNLLSKTEIKQKGIDSDKTYYLEAQRLLNDTLSFWIPEQRLEQLLDQILYREVFQRSAQGAEFSREEYFKKIEDFKEKEIQYIGKYDDERKKMEAQISDVLRLVNNNKPTDIVGSELFSITAKPQLGFLMIKKVEEKESIVLSEWGKILEAFLRYNYSFSVFHILEKQSLISEDNAKYFIDFFSKHYHDFMGLFRDGMMQEHGLEILKKVLEKYPSQADIVFAFIIKILGSRKGEYKDYDTTRKYDGEKKKISELFKSLFEIYRVNNKADKVKEIIEIIKNNFDLVSDDGDYDTYTPGDIFEIIKVYIGFDFENNFIEFTKQFISQFKTLYGKHKGKEVFSGWELSGGGVACCGHNYRVADRHFVDFALKPALGCYYSSNTDEAWNFILQNCIIKITEVSEDRPDFLNRAALPIVLERYKSSDKKTSDEAFEILKEFILSRRGIPHKSDLIYQALRGDFQISDDKKWKLIEVSMNKYGVPVSVFVEEIVSGLANKGNKEAKKALQDWLKNPEYYKKFRFEMNIIQNIRTIFDSDFEYAVSLFEQFINSEYFINKQDSFESYDVARLLYDILKKDNKRGLEIVKQITKHKKLTKNQQIILCFSLFNYGGNDQSDDVGLLEKIYAEFIDPFLTDLNDDIDKIVERLSFSQAREAFVQFAERLARNKKIKKALRIVKVFINDPDPYLHGKDPEDPKNEYNEHQRIENGEEPHSITSTRGWCGWVLMKCSILDGRDYIGQIIDLTEQLAKDKNWYVKHMACFALSQLAQNRLTVLPDNKEVLFFGKNTEEALERSKKVEKIAFDLLKEAAKASDNIQKAMAKSILTAFDHIRILNEKDALTFVNTFKNFTDEAIAEAAPLFIFFAEFRKDAYKDWKWKTDKYYNDLTQFDDKKFKKILLEVIDKLEPKQRFRFAAQFEHLLRDLNYEQDNAEDLFKMAYKYLDYLAGEYNHELSNIIYMTIKNEMTKKRHFNEWHKLFLKYLKKEKEFYDKNFKQKDTVDMYWWPSFYNSDILMFVYNELGKNKFLEALDIITQFPKEIDLNVNDNIVLLLDKFPKTNKKVKGIIARLFEKNPSKYYDLRNKWLGNNDKS